MTTQTIDKLIWTLIYGGLIGSALGLSIQRSDPSLGWSFVSVGGIVAVLGAVLIFVRSRMKDKA